MNDEIWRWNVSLVYWYIEIIEWIWYNGTLSLYNEKNHLIVLYATLKLRFETRNGFQFIVVCRSVDFIQLRSYFTRLLTGRAFVKMNRTCFQTIWSSYEAIAWVILSSCSELAVWLLNLKIFITYIMLSKCYFWILKQNVSPKNN